MAARQRSIIPMIDVNYKQFSPAEKKVADFFIANDEDVDMSASAMAERLFVSEATLSRFAKKSGFSGYREFAFAYRNQKLKKHAAMTNPCWSCRILFIPSICRATIISRKPCMAIH